MQSSQWSICAHPQAVALQVPQCATVSETQGQWCTAQDMMHEVGAQPLDHRTRSAGLETVKACQRTSKGWGGGGGLVGKSLEAHDYLGPLQGLRATNKSMRLPRSHQRALVELTTTVPNHLGPGAGPLWNWGGGFQTAALFLIFPISKYKA